MKGDNITLEAFLLERADLIVTHLLPSIEQHKRHCISVAGESGSGKSVTAYAIKEVLREKGIRAEVIQQDDYFFLPPKTNEMNRRASLDNVGPHEVNLELIDTHLDQFLNGENQITKPLVLFFENKAITETIDLTDVQVLIVEGTYTSLLNKVSNRVFIDRDWDSRIQSIKDRARDVVDNFLEKVLTLEHEIILQHIRYADVVVGEGIDVRFVSKV
jgi:Uridine kinase